MKANTENSNIFLLKLSGRENTGRQGVVGWKKDHDYLINFFLVGNLKQLVKKLETKRIM